MVPIPFNLGLAYERHIGNAKIWYGMSKENIIREKTTSKKRFGCVTKEKFKFAMHINQSE